MKIVAKADKKNPAFKDYYDNLGRQLGDTPVYQRDPRIIQLPYRKSMVDVGDAFMKSRLFAWTRRLGELGVLSVASKMYPYRWSYSTDLSDLTHYYKHVYDFAPTQTGEAEAFRLLLAVAQRIVAPLLQPADVIWAWDPMSDAVHVNVCLRNYDFQRVLPPVQAAQEIDAYLSNIAVTPEAAPAVLPEKVALEAKGFDNWTFKQLPTKVKPRRKVTK